MSFRVRFIRWSRGTTARGAARAPAISGLWTGRAGAVPLDAKRREPLGGYPLRGSSFAASLGAHSVWIGLLVLFSSRRAAETQRPVYDEFVRPYEHKILLYRTPKMPEVAPLNSVGIAREPRGVEKSTETAVATSPQAASKRQTIWLPNPKIEIHQDVQSPDLAVKLNLPGPPPVPPKPEPRAFVPPPPAERPPALLTPAPVLSAAAPSLTAAVGDANIDLVIANLHPTEVMKGPIPEAARPGEFSKSAEKGEAATGEARTAGAIVPNLAVRSSGVKAGAAPEAGGGKVVLYAERLRTVPLTSVSVPLRPASRAIPRAIDARFQGRNVYTMVIPIENLPAYGGDWIIWFAERSPQDGSGPLLRAPIPFRKLERVEPAASAAAPVRVQIAGVLGTDGKLGEISVLGNVRESLRQAAIQDAMAWEFKPASRDGAPVSVEVVLEIPFNVPAALAATGP